MHAHTHTFLYQQALPCTMVPTTACHGELRVQWFALGVSESMLTYSYSQYYEYRSKLAYTHAKRQK